MTHTASVVGIGVAVLVAGALVVILGLRLLVHRWGDRRPARDHDDAHDHDDHSHDHEHAHDHHHGHDHDHAVPNGRPLGLRSLMVMGVSGGIVPCPEALGVLVLAVGVHRTVLGLGMIVAFSTGLAAVLVGIGLVLVSARPGRWLRNRRDAGARFRYLVPLGSAVVVTMLGVAMAVRGVGALAAR